VSEGEKAKFKDGEVRGRGKAEEKNKAPAKQLERGKRRGHQATKVGLPTH